MIVDREALMRLIGEANYAAGMLQRLGKMEQGEDLIAAIDALVASINRPESGK